MFLQNTYDQYADKHKPSVTIISEDLNAFSIPCQYRLKYHLIAITRILQL